MKHIILTAILFILFVVGCGNDHITNSSNNTNTDSLLFSIDSAVIVISPPNHINTLYNATVNFKKIKVTLDYYHTSNSTYSFFSTIAHDSVGGHQLVVRNNGHYETTLTTIQNNNVFVLSSLETDSTDTFTISHLKIYGIK